MAGLRLVDGIAAAMRHLSERQMVIAENVANADTPGFKARALREPDFASLVDVRSGPSVARPAVRATSAMAALGASPASSADTILETDISETKPDGNNVTLEDQLLRLGQVQADFAALTNLYRKQMQLMKTALGRTGGN